MTHRRGSEDSVGANRLMGSDRGFAAEELLSGNGGNLEATTSAEETQVRKKAR